VTALGTVHELWRYPIKSMQGEPIRARDPTALCQVTPGEVSNLSCTSLSKVHSRADSQYDKIQGKRKWWRCAVVDSDVVSHDHTCV
jgi:hypothetical protein